MARPWLSVIMPTYNGSAFVVQAIESIVAQRQDDIELIVVDDGSTDATLSMVRLFEAKLAMSVVEAGRLGSWVKATNVGMARAEGTYISWLHQDDVWAPGRLARLRELITRYSKATLVAHAAAYIDERGRCVGALRAPLPSSRPLAPATVLPHLLVQNFFAPPALLFPRATVKAVGWMDERLWWGADWELCLRLASVGQTVYEPSLFASYRLHRGSLSSTGAHRLGDLRRALGATLERHLTSASPEVARAARFSAEMNVVLAAFAANGTRPPIAMLGRFAMLGPAGWARYLRDSRIVERAMSRWRVRAASR